MSSRLKDLRPVRIKDGDRFVVGPPVHVMANLPIVHEILIMAVEGWHRAVAPYETRIVEGRENPEFVIGQAFIELQPAFLKSLFSYVFFFVAADKAYHTVWRNLKSLNKVARVDAGKAPQPSPVIKKARNIRDWSIAHFPSDKASPLDSVAAMSWTPMTLSRPADGDWNLRDLTFGGFRLTFKKPSGDVVPSSDLEVQGLDALHQSCFTYLEAFDSVCADFLEALHRKASA